MLLSVCVCVCVCDHYFVWLGLFLCTLIQYLGFMGILFFLMLSWKLQHDYLDTCCFECRMCMCIVFLYLHLVSAIEHVSHGKAL